MSRNQNAGPFGGPMHISGSIDGWWKIRLNWVIEPRLKAPWNPQIFPTWKLYNYIVSGSVIHQSPTHRIHKTGIFIH